MTKTVVGLFKSKGQAEKAVDELKAEGVSRDEISIVSRDERASGDDGGGRGKEDVGRGGRETMEAGGPDLGAGIGWGGGVGGLAGILAGAGALAIPGVGPILAAGPLAAVLTGAAVGGISGGLVDYGIPEERGREYEKKVKEGGILTVVHTSEDKADRVAGILRSNGAESVETHKGK